MQTDTHTRHTYALIPTHLHAKAESAATHCRCTHYTTIQQGSCTRGPLVDTPTHCSAATHCNIPRQAATGYTDVLQFLHCNTCIALYCTAAYCKLQYTATHCNTLQKASCTREYHTLQHMAAHGSAWQQLSCTWENFVGTTPLHMNTNTQGMHTCIYKFMYICKMHTLQRFVILWSTLQRPATRFSTLQHAATQCISLHQVGCALDHISKQPTAKHCKT